MSDEKAHKTGRPANENGKKPAAALTAAPGMEADAVAFPSPTKKEKKAAKANAKATMESSSEEKKKIARVRDSFTMPDSEYKALRDVQRACRDAGFEIKKNELLRIGVELIRQTDMAQLKNLLSTLTPTKVGRPKKEK